MSALLVAPYYARWHYTRGIRDLFSNLWGFIVFLAVFFSLGELSRTLFAPWSRMDEPYQSGLRPGVAAGTFIVNTILRVFGFAVRLSVLVAGFLTIVFAMLCSLCLIALWIIFPLIILFLFSLSLKYLISS